MNQSAPLLTSNSTILWLKIILTVVSLVALTIRYRARGSSKQEHSFSAQVVVGLIVVCSFGVFHDLGQPRSGKFIHYGEMFHYYLGSKYFKELGHYDLYNAVIAADAEQDNALVVLPFYTDLHTYQNASRETALANAERVKQQFSAERWSAFKGDVHFFKLATDTPRGPGLMFLVMDHGYNASPVSTCILGVLTNLVPVTQLWALALLDVLLVAAMIVLVFRTFGLEVGGLFSIYFFVNILNDHGYISGGLLRYDWLFCVIASVCLLQRKRYAASSALLTTGALIAVLPAVMFYGFGVAAFRRSRATRSVDKDSVRFVSAGAVTALLLFLLPAIYLGSAVQPWKEFASKITLHDKGVYVNHLGLRGIALYESSHLSLERFVQTYNDGSGDLVRHWQDVKEKEFEQKRPIVMFGAIVVLACVTAIIWKRTEDDVEAVLWPVLLIYAISYPSHYYYVFLCLLALLFLRRADSLPAYLSMCLLLICNVCALLTDDSSPSPIVFYTLVNIYLFVCVSAILLINLRMSPLLRQTSAKPNVAAKPVRSKKKHKGSRRVSVSGGLRLGYSQRA